MIARFLPAALGVSACLLFGALLATVIGGDRESVVVEVPGTLVLINAAILIGSLAVWVLPLARRDGIAFVSVAAPPLVLAATAIIVSPVQLQLLLALAASGYLLVFLAGRNAFWSWWTRHILGRSLPSPQRTFDLDLHEAAALFSSVRWFVDPTQTTRAAARDQAAAAFARLQALEPPDADWRTLRDHLASVMANELAAPIEREIGERQPGAELLVIARRWEELRGREPEWSGLFPTLPEDIVTPLVPG